MVTANNVPLHATVEGQVWHCSAFITCDFTRLVANSGSVRISNQASVQPLAPCKLTVKENGWRQGLSSPLRGFVHFHESSLAEDRPYLWRESVHWVSVSCPETPRPLLSSSGATPRNAPRGASCDEWRWGWVTAWSMIWSVVPVQNQISGPSLHSVE